jgi:hypothetical protein
LERYPRYGQHGLRRETPRKRESIARRPQRGIEVGWRYLSNLPTAWLAGEKRRKEGKRRTGRY